MFGGYCKIYAKGQKTKGLVHQDIWHLKMSTDLSAIRWEKRRKAGGFVPS
jgi:hypothetical protein